MKCLRIGQRRMIRAIFDITIFDANLWIVGTQFSSSELHALDLEPCVTVPPANFGGE